MAGLLDFISGAVSGGVEEYGRQKREQSREEKVKYRLYLQLLMSGKLTEQEARDISGYMGGTGKEAQAVESMMGRQAEEAGRKRQLEIETAAAKKEPFEYLEHQESPYYLKKTTKGVMGTPLQIPTEETFPGRVGRLEREAAEQKEQEVRRKERLALAKEEREFAQQKELATFKAGLKPEGEKTEKESLRDKRIRTQVDKFNQNYRSVLSLGKSQMIQKVHAGLGPKAVTKETIWKQWGKTVPKDIRDDVGQALGIGKTFHGAKSYEEVEAAVANVPEPKRSEILRQAKEFFGVQ